MSTTQLRGIGGHGIGPHTHAEERDIIATMASGLEGAYEGLDDVTIRPNAKNIDDVLAIINADKDCPAVTSPFGKQVPHGAIGIVRDGAGELTAVGRGTYLLPNPRAEWAGIVAIDRLSHERIDELTILRVPKEDLALCTHHNRPIVVSAGKGGGFVVMNDGFFQCDRMVSVNEPHIQHGIMHIVRVTKGYYAKVVCDGQPSLLPSGRHVFLSDTFEFEGTESVAATNCIQHRTITRLDVRAEEYALCWVDNAPLCIRERGVYLIDSIAFRFEKFISMDQRAITHGSLTILNVVEGMWAVVRNYGTLEVLKSGTYEYDDVNVRFVGLFSSQQQSVDLGGRGANRSQTREFVDVDIVAVAFFFVRDPIKMLVTVGSFERLKHMLDETCSSTLSNEVRSCSVLELGDKGDKSAAAKKKQSREPAALTRSVEPVSHGGLDIVADPDDSEGDDGAAIASSGSESDDDALPFLDRVAARVHRSLHAFVLSEYGVELDRLRINDVKVVDAKLRELLSQQSVVRSEIDSQLRNMKDKKKIEIGRADSSAEGEKRQVGADADRVRMQGRAKAQTITQSASAKGEALVLEVNANAKGSIVIARAEAERLKLMASADAERVELVGRTPFGKEFALARMRADAYRDAMSGLTEYVNFTTGPDADPRAMVFNPGDAPPCAGTWRGEELHYAAAREEFVQNLAEEDRARLAAGHGAIRSTSTVAMLTVPPQDVCAQAFADAVGGAQHAAAGAGIALRPDFVALLRVLFPSWGPPAVVSVSVNALARYLAVAQAEAAAGDTAASAGGASGSRPGSASAGARHHHHAAADGGHDDAGAEALRNLHDQFFAAPIEWRGLHLALWFVCHYANLTALLQRFDSAASAAGSATGGAAAAGDGVHERLVALDDLTAANSLLGISEDLKTVYTVLGGFSHGGVPLSSMAAWMATAKASQISTYQAPFKRNFFGSDRSNVPPAAAGRRVSAAAAAEERPSRDRSPSSDAARRREYRDRLVRFFEHYDPEQVQKADRLLNRSAGMEDSLFESLVRRYGPEPPAPAPGRPEYRRTSPPPSASTSPAVTRRADERETARDRLAAALRHTRSGVAPSAAPPAPRPLSYRDRVFRMYKKYNPDKLSSVERLMHRYAGQEEDLIAGLVAKYGPEPQGPV